MFITIKFEVSGDIDVHELLCRAFHEGDDDAVTKLSDYVVNMVVVGDPNAAKTERSGG